MAPCQRSSTGGDWRGRQPRPKAGAPPYPTASVTSLDSASLAVKGTLASWRLQGEGEEPAGKICELGLGVLALLMYLGNQRGEVCPRAPPGSRDPLRVDRMPASLPAAPGLFSLPSISLL